MPLFEYTCQNCHHDCELLIHGQQQPNCPTCGSTQLEKRFSVPAAHVKQGASSLPIAGGNCGRPQCGMGGCQGLN